MATWPPHAPENPAVDLDYVLALAKDTPFLRDCELAVSILSDDVHWRAAATDIPVPKSRFTKAHVAVMCTRKILAEFLGVPLAWGLMTTTPEPSKVPPRQRVISDMIWTNAALPDTQAVHLTTQAELDAIVASCLYGCTFDYSGWFFCLAVGGRVQPYLVVRVGDKLYTHLRGPMGQKFMVFVAQTVTRVLAHTTKLRYDVITDNVLYASDNLEILQSERSAFLARSARARCTMGEQTEPDTTVTYRGNVMHFGKSVSVKRQWADKCVRRIRYVLDNVPTAAQIYSLGGMFAWLRGVIGSVQLDDYFWWRAVARSVSGDPNKRLTLDDNVRKALLAIVELLSADVLPERDVSVVLRRRSLLVTDASQARPLGRWGAIIVTTRLISFAGLFPVAFAIAASIADLETAAIWLALCECPLRDSDIQVFTDNQITSLVLKKRRSSAWRLHALARSIHATVSALGSSITVTWIPSAANPSDGISRGRLLTDRDIVLLEILVRKSGMVSEGIDLHKTTSVVTVEQCEHHLSSALFRLHQCYGASTTVSDDRMSGKATTCRFF